MKQTHIKDLQNNGLTRKQLVQLFGVGKVRKFMDFMEGQTVAIIDGFNVYYYYDITRFFK